MLETVLPETVFGPFPIFDVRQRTSSLGWFFVSELAFHALGVLSHHLMCEMKSPHLVDFSWDLVDL